MNSLVSRGSLFDDFFKDFAPGFYVRPLHGDALPEPSQIKIDVKEDDAAYTVHAEVPGVPKEDINVSIDGNVVSLRAEVRQHDEKKEGEKVLRSERYFGSVARSFQLPADVDAAGRMPCAVRRSTRSARAAAACAWVTSTSAAPCSRVWAMSKSMTRAAVPGSRLPVGSSASSRAGRCTSARALATRCSWPTSPRATWT